MLSSLTATAPLVRSASNSARALSRFAGGRTHDVLNQANPLEPYNMYRDDRTLARFVNASGASWAADMLNGVGLQLGSAEMHEHGRLANANPPTLHNFDRYGHRVDVVEFHPSYHKLMETGLTNGTAAFAWANPDKPAKHVVRGALIYMQNQVDGGTCCPQVMTFACVPALKWQEQTPYIQQWIKKASTCGYDPRNVPIEQKQAITLGMSMTEKQGGSDVRANTTTAKPVNKSRTGPGEEYLLQGHKWFTSAPMCDGFLTLAQTEKGLSCFLIPRWLPDGSRNSGFRVMRLKNKMGDKSNASSEVEYDGAWGTMIGPEGKGINTIINMVQCTRLDCALGSSGNMKQSLLQALHHVGNRSAFGSVLVEQPLMQNLLVDLIVESEAASLMALRMAKAMGDAEANEEEANLFRVGVAVTKYWTTKKQPQFVYECMEAFGGNGYVEDFPLARHFRQSPLNAIWEGSGNVIALDILRAFNQLPALLKECQSVRGQDAAFDRFVKETAAFANSFANDPRGKAVQLSARSIADRLALCLQGATMLKYGDPALTKVFMASRIASPRAVNYGTLDPALIDPSIISAAMPTKLA